MPVIQDLQDTDSTSSRPSAYSRDEVVREVTSFYVFLTKLYIPFSAVRFPPPGGWPTIDTTLYAFLRKDATVIDLIRHLPYISRLDAYNGTYEVYWRTAAVDYEGEQTRRAISLAKQYNENVDLTGIDLLEEGGSRSIPSHAFLLASQIFWISGCNIVLDTKQGTITLMDDNRDLGAGTVKSEVCILLPLWKMQYMSDGRA